MRAADGRTFRGKTLIRRFAPPSPASGRRGDARRHHYRPVLGGPLWRAGGRAPGGHGELLQGGRRLPHQYRDRHGAARPEERSDHARRRRAHGPLHPRELRARGRRRLGRADGPVPIDVPGRARDSRRQDVPADLLSRQLRRQRARRKRHRRSFRGARQGDRRHRHAFRAPRQRRGAEARHSLCEEARPQGRFRHRLSPEPLGLWPATARARSGTSNRTRCPRICARSCPPAISSSARKRRS